MPKKSRVRQWLIAAAAIVFLVVIGGVIFMTVQHYVSIRGQRLNEYCYSSGGGMNGGYNSETVKRYDDAHALITVERAAWHHQDPEVKEYLVDALILDELEGVVRQYRMNFWNRKEFSRIFICDGETDGYSFRFDENDISFSSQVYPAQYRSKLQKLHDTVAKYLQDATVLPGLINPKVGDEESYMLPEGELVLYAYVYSENSLGIRILNGTEEEVEITQGYRLVNTDTAQVVAERDDSYASTVYPRSQDEMRFALTERLAAGHYTLVLGEREIPFAIG